MSVMKDVKILTAPNTYETRDIGAEAQYIEVSLDSNGDIIEDITEPGVTVDDTESLTETLIGMQSNIDEKTNLDMVGDAETIGGHPSRPYVEGEFLLGSDNNLYKVTDDIATSEYITINTNIEETNIAENLGKATDNNFVGTTQEWENLPSTDKAKYTSRDITDDYNGLPIDSTPTQNSGNPVSSGGVYTAIDNVYQTYSNPNLLDNPWFTVNQRGSSNYTELNKYSLDRWKITGDSSSLSITTNSNGVVATASGGNYTALGQYIEKTAITLGREYTLSVMFVDGTVIKGTGLVSDVNVDTRFISTNSYINKVQATLDYDAYNSLYLCRIFMTSPVSNIAIKAVKLELGSRSTLANDVAPNYQQELAKCQRYFYKDNGSSVNTYIGKAMDINWLTGFPFPVTMRIPPAITISIIKEFFFNEPNITSVDNSTSTIDGIANIYKANGFTAGNAYYVWFEASADL